MSFQCTDNKPVAAAQDRFPHGQLGPYKFLKKTDNPSNNVFVRLGATWAG
jgi:hypothetical protein